MSDTRAPLASVGGDGGGTSRGRPDGPGSGCQSSLSQMWATGEAGGGDWGAWPPPSRAAWPFPQPQGRVEVGKAVVGGVCHALEGRPGADSESVAGPLWPLRQVISGPSSPLHSEGSVHYPAYVLCSSSFFMVSISLTVST